MVVVYSFISIDYIPLHSTSFHRRLSVQDLEEFPRRRQFFGIRLRFQRQQRRAVLRLGNATETQQGTPGEVGEKVGKFRRK